MNAATSPLLLLPSEVRENILTHLVGDKLIHVRHLEVHQVYHANKAKMEYERQSKQGGIIVIEDDQDDELPSYTEFDPDDTDDEVISISGNVENGGMVFGRDSRSVIRHAICVANQSEQSAYKEAVSGHAIVPKDDSPDFYIASCDERHSACSMCGSGDMFLHQDLRVDLNILGVCRQLYEEANYLLWTTNTFSFDDPKSFEKFFASLNPAQKRNLTNIHINAHIGEFYNVSTTHQQRSRFDRHYWGKALKMSTLRMLQGVQTLYLCINLGFRGGWDAISPDVAAEQIEKCQQADMEPILRLRALSSKKVTVIVSDEPKKLEEGDSRIAYRWTAGKKNEYAESIRVQLLDEKGATLVKTEAEAANLQRLTASKDNAIKIVKRYKKILKAADDEVDRIQKWTNIQEDHVALVQQEADESSKKNTKKYSTLLWTVGKEKGAATTMKEWLNTAVRSQSAWQENLAKAKEKRNRAMTRLGATPDDILDESEAEDLMEDIDDSS